MRHIEYKVIFITGKTEFEYALGYREAIILAQACQIRKGNDYTVAQVINVETDQIVWTSEALERSTGNGT